MPAISCLRMRKRVNPAPTSIPPTAIGRTIEYHTLNAIPPQYAAGLAPAADRWQRRPQEINKERD